MPIDTSKVNQVQLGDLSTSHEPWLVPSMPYGAASSLSVDRNMQAMLDEIRKNRDASMKREQRVAEFRERYLTVRASNIVLDHQSAIELVRMIFQEADTLTYEDTV